MKKNDYQEPQMETLEMLGEELLQASGENPTPGGSGEDIDEARSVLESVF